MSVTWNPADKHANIILSNGNLTATATADGWKSVRATLGKSSGKWYWEVKITAGTAYNMVGVGTSNAALDNYVGIDIHGYGYFGNIGSKYHNGPPGIDYGASYILNDIIGVALDLDNGKIWWSKNGVWQASGDPAAGTNEAYSGLSGTFYPVYSPYTNANAGTGRFTSGDQTYSPPSGFDPIDVPVGWTGKVIGVTDPAKVMGIAVANISKIMGV